MNLNVSAWKEFRFGNLITDIYKAKAINKDDLTKSVISAKAIRYITRTNENNGCEMLADITCINPNYIELGNAITIGDTTATCFYQADQFITGDHMVIIRSEWLNEILGLFIVTILKNEQYKYSYGRAFLIDRICNTIIKLPIQYNSDGTPFIDNTNKYNEEGYIPDFKFMENYIKSLYSKPLTTKNKERTTFHLNVNEWKEFKIPSLFEVSAGIYHHQDEYDEGYTPYISATNIHNGITQRINLHPDFNGNVITIGKIGATTYYQSESFCATSDVNILIPKFNMNRYIGLFISRVINFSENYKWSYGRQCRVGDSKEIIIKLPIKHNLDGTILVDDTNKYSENGYIPDFKFMEDYIKSLPYGDRL